MSGMIYDLISILKEQLTCYEYLCGLALEKKEYIIQNDLEGIEKISKLENYIVYENSSLEKKRVCLVTDIAEVLNLDKNTLTIKDIVRYIENKTGYEELLEISNQIKEKIETLKVNNENNKILIHNSLEYIDFTMNALRSSFNPIDTTYSAKKEHSISQKRFFDACQ